MRKIYYFVLSILLMSHAGWAQRNCPTTVDFSVMQSQNPSRYQRFMSIETFTSNYIQSSGGANYRLADPNGVIVIPVVVHVLHRNEAVGTGLNISQAQIQSQIDVLNEDFRRMNADRINTPAAFTGVAADYNFEFRLACQDPNGHPTNGVVRRFTNRTGFQFVANADGTANETSMGIKMTSISGSDPWPTDRYLNIWVCNFTDGTLGYGTFPADFATNPNVDGVVINTTSMGRTGNVAAPFDRGRTATHEVGHWLNLFHVWGDAFCGDDLVADTPTQQQPNFGCPAFPHRTCGNTTNGDMFMNYMDYTDDVCMNIFTNDQSLRGRALFAAGGPRGNFVDNYFRIQQPTSTINCSAPIRLTNPNCLAATWTVVSGPATLSASSNSQTTITANGTGTVVLRASGGNYVSEVSFDINNNPPPADYSTLIYASGQRGVDPVSLCPGCTSLFRVDFVPGATSYTWRIPRGFTISGQGTSSPYITATVTPGTYTIYCSANNACGSSWTHDLRVNVESGGGGGIQRIAVYPNPAKQDLTIEYAQSDTESSAQITQREEFVIKLYDSNNIEVKSGTSSNGKLILDTSSLKGGIYYLHVKDNKGTETMQILIQR
jgi:hypothetical protein